MNEERNKEKRKKAKRKKESKEACKHFTTERYKKGKLTKETGFNAIVMLELFRTK